MEQSLNKLLTSFKPKFAPPLTKHQDKIITTHYRCTSCILHLSYIKGIEDHFLAIHDTEHQFPVSHIKWSATHFCEACNSCYDKFVDVLLHFVPANWEHDEKVVLSPQQVFFLCEVVYPQRNIYNTNCETIIYEHLTTITPHIKLTFVPNQLIQNIHLLESEVSAPTLSPEQKSMIRVKHTCLACSYNTDIFELLVYHVNIAHDRNTWELACNTHPFKLYSLYCKHCGVFFKTIRRLYHHFNTIGISTLALNLSQKEFLDRIPDWNQTLVRTYGLPQI